MGDPTDLDDIVVAMEILRLAEGRPCEVVLVQDEGRWVLQNNAENGLAREPAYVNP